MPRCPLCRLEHAEGEPCPTSATTLLGASGTAGPEVQPKAPAPLAQDPLVGRTLGGRYEIVGWLGAGGMGAVYEGRHTLLGRRVAVKVLLDKYLDRQDFVARLLREARLASAIGHEHIVSVLDCGTTEDERPFLVMEHLEGEPLGQLVRREAPLPASRALRIVRQAASALAAAHDKGIIHRDVKADNIFIVPRSDDDFVKVLDFGISKATVGTDALSLASLTHTGLLLGTPVYLSPEQARGQEDLDHRIDVWALGIVLYECLVGETPFRAANYLGLVAEILTREVPRPSALRPELGITPAVESVLMKALAKDRDDRYLTMADFERALAQLLETTSEVEAARTGRSPSPSSGGGGRITAIFFAVAFVGGLALLTLRLTPPAPRRRPEPPAAGSAAAVPAPSAAPPALATPPAEAARPATVGHESGRSILAAPAARGMTDASAPGSAQPLAAPPHVRSPSRARPASLRLKERPRTRPAPPRAGPEVKVPTSASEAYPEVAPQDEGRR